MERIIVNSALPGFVLLDEITEAGPDRIAGRRDFVQAPAALGIEALAQLGAMHVRYLLGFESHAFLLSVKHCKIDSGQPLNGTFHLYGVQDSCSRLAYSYMLRAVQGDRTSIEGNFLFASAGYDQVFKKHILQSHYRKLFSRLRPS